jgi:hypothetical protein
MAINIFSGDLIADTYSGYYSNFNFLTNTSTILSIITNTPNSLNNQRLSVDDTNAIINIPDKFKVIEAIYLTEASYSVDLIYSNGYSYATNNTGVGNTGVRSLSASVRSNTKLNPDPAVDPTLIPFSTSPYAGYRNPNQFEIGTPSDWALRQPTLGYLPTVQDTVELSLVQTVSGIEICRIPCKRWVHNPVQYQFEYGLSKQIVLYEIPAVIEKIEIPIYFDLVRGYTEDSRTVIDKPIVVPSESKRVKLAYYRENKLEPIPGLRSIDWMIYHLDLVAEIPCELPIVDCVLGTLFVSDSAIVNQIENFFTVNNKYPSKYYFANHVQELFLEWYLLIGAALPVAQGNLRVIAANNNHWSNNPAVSNDVNYSVNHELFTINNSRSYDWHIQSQLDGSYGDLVMDSPRTIEIHTALNASQYLLETPDVIGTGTIDNPQTPAKHKLDYYIKNSSIPTAITDKITAIWKALGGDKYATNLIDAAREKVTNLGFLVENIARVNGLRFNDDGDIDLVKERDLYRHKTIENPSLGLPSADGKYNDYGVSCFGKIGMIIPHLPTTYKAGGKSAQLFDVVHDNQQLAIAILRQQDVSLSIQHGSEIRLKGLDGKVQAYPNQLAVQLECLQRLEKISYQTDKNLIVSTVAGTEIRELFSGIGIPVTQKSLMLTDPKNGKAKFSIPYFGHQKNKPSTAQLLTTVHVNLAVINGVLMPKKQPQASITNPFKRFTAPK